MGSRSRARKRESGPSNGASPPEHRDEASNPIGHHIERIPRGMHKEPRPHPFKQHRPKRPVSQEFRPGRHPSPGTQPKPLVDRKQDRQGARDEEQVVEVGVKERQGEHRFQAKAIDEVRSTPRPAKRIPPAAKRIHSSARITTPVPSAIASLIRNVVMEPHPIPPLLPLHLLIHPCGDPAPGGPRGRGHVSILAHIPPRRPEPGAVRLEGASGGIGSGA